jgi:ornithine cyclodeaminase
MPAADPLLIDARTTHRLLDFPYLVDALHREHMRGVDELTEQVLVEPAAAGVQENAFLMLPAWRHGEAIGVKLVTSFPGNLSNGSGLMSVQGSYVLFEGRNGSVRAVIDGAALTLRKTAADSAVVARVLAREDAATMLMVGAGALGPYVVEAMRAVRPSLRRILVWNRTASRAEDLVASLKQRGIDAEHARDLEPAVRTADLISCATMSDRPLVMGRWLKEGAHLDLIGGWSLAMRECDEEAVKRSRVFYGKTAAIERTGDLTLPLQAGVVPLSHMLASAETLIRGGHAGRTSPRDITLYKNIGGGHLDLYSALALVARVERGD